jgi:hypothetical protein
MRIAGPRIPDGDRNLMARTRGPFHLRSHMHAPFNRIGNGLSEDRDLWTMEDMGCEKCGHRWTAGRSLGIDHRKLQCPFCGAQDSNLEEEAAQITVRH